MTKHFAVISREVLDKKPPHGAPCTRCGLCCMASLCDLGRHLFPNREGRCPALVKEDNGDYSCGAIKFMHERDPERAKAAELLLYAGKGCTMKLASEERNHAFDAKLNQEDQETLAERKAARELWGMPERELP